MVLFERIEFAYLLVGAAISTGVLAGVMILQDVFKGTKPK